MLAIEVKGHYKIIHRGSHQQSELKIMDIDMKWTFDIDKKWTLDIGH